MAVIKGGVAILNALDEVFCFHLKGFKLIYFWGPHVACPVANQHVVDTLPVTNLYSFIIYPDLFVCAQVIPYEHLFLAAYKGHSYLDWRQPVDIKVGYYIISELNSNIGYILSIINMSFSGCPYGNRFVFYQIVHDR